MKLSDIQGRTVEPKVCDRCGGPFIGRVRNVVMTERIDFTVYLCQPCFDTCNAVGLIDQYDIFGDGRYNQ